MTFTILSDTPRIREYKGLLSIDECNALIKYAEPSLVSGRVLDEYGKNVIDYLHRDAFTAGYKNDSTLIDNIIDRVSKTIDIDKDRFEILTFIKYNPGQHFKVHQDYFIPTEHIEDEGSLTDKRCEKGGNRVSTVLLYLNDVESSGETTFPWLDLYVKPEAGKLLQFDYGYDDHISNVRSQHEGLPVITGEKWIITIWIREHSTQEQVVEYKKFNKEADIYKNITDVSYSLECGPDYDRKTFDIDLPGNINPKNTIIVGFTGGMDSCLLLYLLGVLNNNMTIPYHIQPVCVTSKNCVDENKIFEDWDNIEFMNNLIRDKIGGNIKKVSYISAKPDIERPQQVDNGLRVFYDHPSWYKARKNVLIYTGTNANPINSDERWINAPNRLYDVKHPWYTPFINLQKYHIIDALLQLELEDIIEYTSKCVFNHIDLDENCIAFACNERRWGLSKINTELGKKYFLNKGKIYDKSE